MPAFTTTIVSGGGDTTGIEVPDEVMAELGGKRVPVTVTINGAYSYPSTTAVMGGRTLVPLAKEHRRAVGVAAGDQVTVQLERDDSSREVEVPPELAAAFESDAVTAAAWAALAPSRKKEHARSINDAKTDATRERRVEKVLDALRSTAAG